ncbi:MAG: hypothetical protein JWM57_3251 [Phycisphaerales bacterium]|nr:hypothetical protein [Phycisphaerales bacterium]
MFRSSLVRKHRYGELPGLVTLPTSIRTFQASELPDFSVPAGSVSTGRRVEGNDAVYAEGDRIITHGGPGDDEIQGNVPDSDHP